MCRLHVAILCSALLPTMSLAQEVREVTVAAETRLDWAFAAADFGAAGQKLPKDFDSRTQRYQLFVPKEYNAEKAWPLIAFISPGDGPSGWANFRQACTERGMLFCSPYRAGNSCPAALRTRIVLDMLDDVRRKYRIDPERTYLGGFSGGGRMACTIAFYLPEYFGGVIPVCGTNPPPRLTYLRHRLQDRLSVAFVTGETDFNRKENELYMQPYFAEIGVHAKLWVAPRVGHSIPGGKVLDEAIGWLEEDVKRRRADTAAWPDLGVASDRTPNADEQASALLSSARAVLQHEQQTWRGVALLQGAIHRWPKSESGKNARQLLQKVAADPDLLKHVEVQGAEDEQRFLIAQAKSFERFGLLTRAIEAWQLLAQSYAETSVGRRAEAEIQRLRGK